MMNKTIFTGRLGGDPEVRYTSPNNTAVARFSLAIDKMDKDHNNGFINCVAFGKLAEFAEKYLRKGIKIEFEGHVSPGSYEKDGRRVYTYDFIAERMGFAESKNNSNQNSNGPIDSSLDDDGFMSIPDGIEEELPFN